MLIACPPPVTAILSVLVRPGAVDWEPCASPGRAGPGLAHALARRVSPASATTILKVVDSDIRDIGLKTSDPTGSEWRTASCPGVGAVGRCFAPRTPHRGE